MSELTLLMLFLPTSFFISITPGLCMTMAMSLGLTIGIRRTLFMMLGEVLGVATVVVAAILGVAAIMLNYPSVFAIFKWVGGAYLIYLGIQMWRNKGKLSLQTQPQEQHQTSAVVLFTQGFVTAIANPKGWAFMMTLLPPFIDSDVALAPQLMVITLVIMFTEFVCMMIYASGGYTLKNLLSKGDNLQLVNRVSGSFMMAIGLWLAFG